MKSGMKMLMAANRGGGSGGRSEGGSGNSEMRQNYGGMEYGRSEMGYNRGGSGGRNEMRNERSEMRYEMENGYGESEMRGMENRYRQEGRSEMRGGMESEMGGMEPENRRRFPRRRDGTFAPRSEMRQESGGQMHYPMYPMPLYDEEGEQGTRMHQIGFQAESAGQKYRGNIVPMRGVENKLTSDMAEEWMGGLMNEDGSKGPHWSMEQTKQVMAQRGIKGDPIEFYAIMNALYSDYCKVFQKHNVNKVDLYADLTNAWINDKDAQEGKAALYFECIAQK